MLSDSQSLPRVRPAADRPLPEGFRHPAEMGEYPFAAGVSVFSIGVPTVPGARRAKQSPGTGAEFTNRLLICVTLQYTLSKYT